MTPFEAYTPLYTPVDRQIQRAALPLLRGGALLYGLIIGSER